MGVELLFWVFIGGSTLLTSYAWIIQHKPKIKKTNYISSLEAPDYYKPVKKVNLAKALYNVLGYINQTNHSRKLDV